MIKIIGIDPDMRKCGVCAFHGGKIETLMSEDVSQILHSIPDCVKGGEIFALENVNAIKTIYAKNRKGGQAVQSRIAQNVGMVKSASKTGNSSYGPWAQWYDRMAVKSALHRLARRLPSSSETAQLIEVSERDIDARFDSSRDVTPAKEEKPQSLLDAFGS